tara:strand:- start:1332 stop:2081 length:750 start_codon:yes stop_codon:yes gene_type:complete
MAAITSAVVGIASGVGSAVMEFNNAKEQKDLASEADKAAAKFMADARRKAEKDMYEGLTIPMDAYEAQFENNLAVQQQQTEALQEGDVRGLAAGVGKIGAIGGANAEATRIKMGKEISALERTKADSKDAINQQLLEMDAAGAREQNQRKRDAEASRAASMTQGVAGVTQALGSAADLVPLYGKNAGDRRASKLIDKFGDTSALQGKSRGEQMDLFSGLTKDQYKSYIDKDFTTDQFEMLSNFDFNSLP